MGFKGIAKVDRGCVLGCDSFLDTRGGGEEERDADKSRNGDNINDSGTDGRRQMATPRECTYTDFLKFQPMSFQGTEGVFGLTRCALTWWNSHMRAVRQDVSYAMPWAALKRMITDKYCPRGEIQKLECNAPLRKEDRYIIIMAFHQSIFKKA
nr:hypothetical protein [Tanacetum cinerariifolium]